MCATWGRRNYFPNEKKGHLKNTTVQNFTENLIWFVFHKTQNYSLSVIVQKVHFQPIKDFSPCGKTNFLLSRYLTTIFWGKAAWRPPSKWNTRVFFCIFQKNSAMATLGLKEMGKFLWEGREQGLPCWLSQFSSFGKCKKSLW